MCRKRWVLLVLGLSCTRGLTGQDLPRLQARADSLAREWRHATAVADAIDSLERARVFVGHDTIRVGALTIVTNASPLPLHAAAARAWPLIDSAYGDDARQLEERPYVIVPVDPDTTIERPPWHNGTEIPWDQDVTSLTLLLLSTVPIAPADTALQGWLGGPVRPLMHARRWSAMSCGWAAEPRIAVWWRVRGCRSPIDWRRPGGSRSTRCSLAGERRFSRRGPCPFRCLPGEFGSPSAGRCCSPSAACGARDGARAEWVARR